MVGRFIKVLQSRWDYARFVYGHGSWTAWQLVAATVALLGIFLPTVLPGGVVAGINGVALAIAVFTAVLGAVYTYLRWWSVVLEPATPEAVQGVQWTESGWLSREAFASSNGSGTRIWWSPEVDASLHTRDLGVPSENQDGDRAITPARLDPVAYRLPGALQDVAAAALRHSGSNWERTLRLPVRFNGRCLGLTVEPTPQAIASGELVFEPVSYFDGECSNELWHFRIRRDGVTQSVQAASLAVDRAGRALSLDQSQVANIVGISLFAVTSDHKVMLVRQTQHNSIAPGALASSSSGSLDLADYPRSGRRPLWALKGPSVERAEGPVNGLRVVMSGMLRELHEECLVRPERGPGGALDYFAGEVRGETARVTGYWRWESRTMKPEFSGIVQLNVTSEALASRKHKGSESTFTEGLVAVDADVLVRAAHDLSFDAPTGWERQVIDDLREAVARDELPSGEREVTSEQIDAVEMSPSCEQAWVHAVRFVAEHPDWLSGSEELGAPPSAGT